MADSVVDNKRIAVNTVILYARMIVTTLISLYTVRVVLDVLGVVDYGIYNVVGSIVAFAMFLNGAMTAASNRFFSVEIAHKKSEGLTKVFSMNIIILFFLLMILVILLETIGVWYLNNKMVIPAERISAANWVFQFSILALALSIITVPYTSMVITHEKMSVFAYISIFDSVARLVIAIVLTYISYDKLIVYGILQSIVSLCDTFFYVIYCRIHYIESRFKWFWDNKLFKELMSFTGWFFLGTTSVIIKSEGVNIIINSFFNPAINAARAIAFQVESAVIKFSDSFFTAAKPQIYMAYANKEYENLLKLINRTTILCSYLMLVLALPLAFNAEIVLSIWLKDVPEHTVLFLQLILVDGVINAISNPIILTIVASGRIKYYQIAEFTLRIIALPICYVALLFLDQPEITVVVSIVLSLCSYIMRATMLKRELSLFEFRKYIVLSLKTVVSSVAICLITHLAVHNVEDKWVFFILSCAISIILLTGSTLFGLLHKDDRTAVLSLVKNKIWKNK